MRTLAFVAFFCVALSVHAQNTAVVETDGLTFVPAQVTITVGDTVRWFNTGGTHNVNGTMLAYPDNPESFGNAVGSGWVYAHKFTMPGTYNYHCDPHLSFGMTGVVIVEDISVGLEEISPRIVQQVFPVPASDFVVLQLNDEQSQLLARTRIKLYDQAGREHVSQAIAGRSRVELNVRDLPAGCYFYQLIDGERVLNTGKIVIE